MGGRVKVVAPIAHAAACPVGMMAMLFPVIFFCMLNKAIADWEWAAHVIQMDPDKLLKGRLLEVEVWDLCPPAGRWWRDLECRRPQIKEGPNLL